MIRFENDYGCGAHPNVLKWMVTTNEESSSKGAMTLTCTANGVTVKVRTVVLLDQNGELVTADYFQGENINVNGFVDYFSGEYQIKVFSLKDITFNQQ